MERRQGPARERLLAWLRRHEAALAGLTEAQRRAVVRCLDHHSVAVPSECARSTARVLVRKGLANTWAVCDFDPGGPDIYLGLTIDWKEGES